MVIVLPVLRGNAIGGEHLVTAANHFQRDLGFRFLDLYSSLVPITLRIALETHFLFRMRFDVTENLVGDVSDVISLFVSEDDTLVELSEIETADLLVGVARFVDNSHEQNINIPIYQYIPCNRKE